MDHPTRRHVQLCCHEWVPDLRFLGKINPFSEAFRRDLRGLSSEVDSMSAERAYVLGMATRPEPYIPNVFLASITGARLVTGTDGVVSSGSPDGADTSKNRWIYQWTKYPNDSVTSGGYTRFAINGAEMTNSSLYEAQSYGVEINETDPKISLVPIGANTRQPIVLMMRLPAPVQAEFYVSDDSFVLGGSVVMEAQYFFSAGNEVEVDCTL